MVRSSDSCRRISVRAPIAPFLLLAAATVYAQFTVVGPAPYPDPVARQKIRTLLLNVDSANQNETTHTLTGLLNWYRELMDEELITAWQKEPDKRPDLAPIIDTMATPRVASGIMKFSWQERNAAFRIDYAPLYEHLMIRYQESARPMLDDLLGNAALDLSPPAAETVCRMFIDMPDSGPGRQNALRILPHYRAVALRLLNQDTRSGDRDRREVAEFWLNDPRSTLYTGSGASAATASSRSSLRSRPAPPQDPPSGNDRPFTGPSPDADSAASSPSTPPPAPSTSQRPTLLIGPAPTGNAEPSATRSHSATPSYSGPRSGTLECSGAAIPQNAEYVFRNLPAAKIQLDYDTRVWEARLAPADGQTQKLILKNRSSGSQKHCKVHWTVTQ